MKNKSIIKSAKEFLESDSGCATITKIVLALIAVSGLMTVAISAPNILYLANKFHRSKKLKLNEQNIERAFRYLRKCGAINTKIENGETALCLTDKGRTKILEFNIESIKIKKPWRWDRKWRVLIYDIPVRFKKAREAFRFKLKEMGLVQMQKSTWIYPYDFLEEVMFIADHFCVKKYIDYMEVSRLTRAKEFQKLFNLRK